MKYYLMIFLGLLSINTFASEYNCNIKTQNGLVFKGEISLNEMQSVDSFFLTEDGVFKGSEIVDRDFFKQRLSAVSFALVGPQRDYIMVTVTQMSEGLPQVMGMFQPNSPISMISGNVQVSCDLK